MSQLQVNQIITLKIHGLGSSGEGVGYYEGFTFFVDGALPGETIEAKIYEKQKKFGRAHLTKIIESSPDRVQPACQLFGKCGGCQLMHLNYSKQLEIKRQKVLDALTRIGKIENCPVENCIPSPDSLAYRNKIQLPVRAANNTIEIGLYAKSSHDLIKVDHCFIHCELGEQIFKNVQELVKNSDITPYDTKTGQGDLRHILIKSSAKTNEVLVILVTNGKGSESVKVLAEKIMKSNTAVKGVVQNINKEQSNVILGDQYKVLVGQGYITEDLIGLKFKVSPASFFQVNPKQAENLYTKALEFSELKGNESILDAYCGVGTLSLIFSRHCKNVIGVECVPEAIADAKENAALNEIKNIEFYCENSEDFISKLDSVDVIILNPPRKGCEQTFLDGIGRLKPSKLIYISCDPATLARDLAYLRNFGYNIDKVQPFDMFPQTAHVETVVRLSLK